MVRRWANPHRRIGGWLLVVPGKPRRSEQFTATATDTISSPPRLLANAGWQDCQDLFFRITAPIYPSRYADAEDTLSRCSFSLESTTQQPGRLSCLRSGSANAYCEPMEWNRKRGTRRARCLQP